MKKLLSSILASAMLLTSLPSVLAQESEPIGEYNSLRLPVVNEVKSEDKVSSYNSEMSLFSLEENLKSSPSSSTGGGSGGGGGSAAVTPDPAFDGIIMIDNIPAQTENKGDMLRIENFKQSLSGELEETVQSFYENYYDQKSVIIFETSGIKKILLSKDILLRDGNDGKSLSDLCIPIPKELDNGTYNVTCYQVNSVWNNDYTKGIKIAFSLSVTDADPENTDPASLNNVIELENNSATMLEGNFDKRPEFMIKDGLPYKSDVQGFAISEDGSIYGISAWGYEGDPIIMDDSANMLPVGKYECYFYINNEAAVDEYTNTLFGPAVLNIMGVCFEKQYYSANKKDNYVTVNISESVARTLPEESGSYDFTVAMSFKDSAGNTVHTINNLEAHNFYCSSWDASFGTNFNFAGLEPGSYNVEMTLYDEAGTAYELGSATLNITDKSIIDYVSILNYNGTLTTSTQYFYVELEINNMFLDYDKININLLNDDGDVVAQTVSKELRDIDSCASALIYKLQVDEPLQVNGDYQLDIQTDSTIELVSQANEVYISVTERPCVVRAELIGNNTVKVYTENLLPGEYLVTSNYAADDPVYNIVLDEQGVGVFLLEDIGNSSYYYYCLRTLDNNSIDDFNVRIPSEQSRFYSDPLFLSPNMTQIDDFYVQTRCDNEKPNVDDIEYARINQNGEIVATMSDFKIDGWSYYSGQASVAIDLIGKLAPVAGKTLINGTAVFEIKYKNGTSYQETIPVTDETTDLYGDFIFNNSCYYNKSISGEWCNNAVGNNKASFVIHNTNATTGKVELYSSEDDSTPIEELDLSELTKTTKYGYSNTYTGSFNTTLSSDKIYNAKFTANSEEKQFSRFTYYPGKLVEQINELIATNGSCDIYLYDWINISNIKNITFKAKIGDQEYNVPVTESYSGDNYIDFEADFSSVPVGYFTLKAFEGTNEIKMTNNTLGYNFGATSEPTTRSVGWRWDNDVRIFSLYGANLDKVNTAALKIYKHVDFAEAANDYYRTKLQYVKDLELAKPYGKTSISVDKNALAELETGAYTFVYMIDGVPAETQEVYIRGAEPEYKAEITVNGGIAFTNKSNVDMAISCNGYTKMKTAFSETELANADYEAITTQKNISLADKNGLVTIYVQFANDDESKTDIVTASITVDTVAPIIENVEMPEINLWNSGEITFTTNEALRNAFFVTGNENAESGLVEGRNYVFSLQDTQNGVYTYKCNFYADSQYEDISSVKSQIIAIDKAGNKTTGEIKPLNISQPRNISGKITYAGNGVSDTSVYLYKDGACVKYAYTNENGEFTFYDVAADNYSISVNKYGFNRESISIAKGDFVADIENKNIALETIYSNNSLISVVAKDYSGAVIKDAYVSVYSWDTGINIAANTNENGLAAINVPYQTGGTSYRVYASYKDFSKTDYITVDSDTKEVTISFPQRATISGTVLKGEDKIANTEISITGSGYTTYAYTNENGEFSAEVYLVNENKTFTVAVNNSKYSGSAEAIFENDSLETSVTLNLKGNIRVKGNIKDNMAQPITQYSSICFNGNGIYQTVTPDANGEFETPDVFGAGTYTVYAYGSWPYKYETIQETFVITEEDLNSSIKELNLIGKKAYEETKFTTGKNGITATADIISKGDVVTVSVKFQNDGTSTLSNVVAYAKIPENVDVKETNGVKNEDGTVSKTVTSLKADEIGTLTFTLDTDNYADKALVIPAYVKVGDKEYPLGAITVQLVSVTLDAPQVVKENTQFKVSGEAVSGSTVEILNYSTKKVLATTDLTSKWYFADVAGLSEDTTLIAKVSKDGKIGYSQPVTVKVDANPITLKDAKIKWGYNLSEYGINENFGYPTLSIWEGYSFDVSASFENMPADAIVTYSFIDKKNVSTQKDGDYYKGTIKNWNGYGTKKVIATVTDGDNVYEFIVAELVILIDPSGYITDAETGNPIVGANVLLEVKSGEDWVTWDATPHLQKNPMLTDEQGHYGWMVPEGEYRIIVTADGYETKIVEQYNSRDYGDNSKITVLPVRTDVDITLTNSRAVELDKAKTVSISGNRIKFVFTRPVKASTVTNDNLKVIDSAGNIVEGSITLAENNTVAIFKPATTMNIGNYKLSVTNISDESGHVISPEEITFEKIAENEALANPTVTYNGTDKIITIAFAEGKEPVNIDEIIVKQGSNTVNGVLRKTDNVITFIPDAELLSNTTYNVVIPDTVRTANDNFLAAPYEYSFTTSGGGSNSHSSGGGGGGSSLASYKITVTQGENGKISPETVSVTKSKSQTFTITPNEGYAIESVLVNGENVGTVSSYTFENVVNAGTITATFKKIEDVKWVNPFGDVKENDWFYAAVKFAFEKGITSGVSESSYNPQGKVTRGQFITMLCRAYGISAMTGDNFADSGDTWYTGYLAAAKQLGISNGVGDNKFAPDKEITREEMVTLIYNYLKSTGKASEDATGSDFADNSLISGWAKTAVDFASENSIVKGKDNNMFDPQGTATRAELAQILYNLLNIA